MNTPADFKSEEFKKMDTKTQKEFVNFWVDKTYENDKEYISLDDILKQEFKNSVSDKYVDKGVVDTGLGWLKDAGHGASVAIDAYGASINKGLDAVMPDKASEALGLKENQKFWNDRKQMHKTAINNKYAGLAGEMIGDPLNFTPVGIINKGSKVARVAKSIGAGAGIGATTMAFKNYGDDKLSTDEKLDQVAISSGIVATLNGIIAGVTKGRVTNVIKDIGSTKNIQEVADSIIKNTDAYGLSKEEAQTVAKEIIKYPQPKVQDKFKKDQVHPSTSYPNFILTGAKNPPVVYNEFVEDTKSWGKLSDEINGINSEKQVSEIIEPQYTKENVYPQQPKGTSTPNFVSGDFNNNIPVPYNADAELMQRYQKIASHPRLQELLSMRESISAKDAQSPQRVVSKGGYRELDGYGGEDKYAYDRPLYEKNYATDFHLTKQDIGQLYRGQYNDNLLSKLETDLDTLDNHPNYAEPMSAINDIDYKAELAKLDDAEAEKGVSKKDFHERYSDSTGDFNSHFKDDLDDDYDHELWELEEAIKEKNLKKDFDIDKYKSDLKNYYDNWKSQYDKDVLYAKSQGWFKEKAPMSMREKEQLKNTGKYDINSDSPMYQSEVYNKMQTSNLSKMSPDDWKEANELFSKGIDNLAAGTYAGIEQDENGNISFDPEKFILGLGGYTAVKMALKNKKVQGVLKDYAQKAIDIVDMNPAAYKENGLNAINSDNSISKLQDIPWDKLSKKEASKMVKILKAIPNNKGIFKNNTIIKTNEGDVKVTDLFAKKEAEKHLDNPNLRGMVTTEEVVSFPKVSKNIEANKNYQGDTWNAKTNDDKNIVYGSKEFNDENNLITVHSKTKKGERGQHTSNVNSSNINDTVSMKPSSKMIIPQTENKLNINAGHNMAGGFAGGSDSLINQRDYNNDGEYDYKDLLAGVAAGTISINALKKIAPKLFDEGAEKAGVKAGLFAGSKAKGYNAKSSKNFDGKYDGMSRFEIDDSKAVLKGTPEELNKIKDEIHWQNLTSIREQYKSGVLGESEAMKLFKATEKKMSNGSTGTHQLSDVLDHKELFDNYPKLFETKVTFTEMPKGASGYYDAQANEIVVSSLKPSKEMKSTLLHEIQHAIQNKEGFARGGSAQEFYNNAKSKIDLLKNKLELEPDKFIQDKMMAKLQKLKKTYNTKGEEEAFEMYQKLAGEIEARDVQVRADYTPKQRKEITPYSSENIAPEDANIRFESDDSLANKMMNESKESFTKKLDTAKAKGYEHVRKMVSDESLKEWGDVSNAFKKNFTDTLSKEYHDKRENVTSTINGETIKLERLHNALNELNEVDKKSLHNYVAGVDTKLDKTLVPLAKKIKKDIHTLSKSLVDKKVLGEDEFKEWENYYIHRSYEKHFFKDVKTLLKQGFKLDDIHKRGKIEVLSDKKAKEFIDSVKPEIFSKPLRDGGFRIKKRADGKFELRRDWTLKEREDMQEITDAAITIPETLMKLKQLNENAKFLQDIEKMDDVVLRNGTDYTDEELKNAGYAKLSNDVKYGVLSGKVIRADVANDLKGIKNEIFNTFGNDGSLARIWKSYLGIWKKSKTVWNVPSHVNNFMSNIFLMHLSGMNTLEITTSIGKAGKMMIHGNAYEKLLKKKLLGKATAKNIEELEQMGNDLKYFLEAKEGGLLGRSQLNDILAGQQNALAGQGILSKADKFAQDAYHNGDAINRIAMYSHLRQKLKIEPDEARKMVLMVMPDYSKPMPRGYKWLRDTGVSPFISWTYYTMPAVMKLIKTKQGAAQAAKALGTLSILEWALTGGEITPLDNIPFMDTKKPENFKGRRFAIGTNKDKITTIKTDRWIPYVELLNPINFAISMFSGPSMKLATNITTSTSANGMIDTYTGRPITYDTKSASLKAYDYFKYLTQSYVPLPAQAYTGWNIGESMIKNSKKRKTNKVIVPRTSTQEALKFSGLNSLTYSKKGLRHEQKKNN